MSLLPSVLVASPVVHARAGETTERSIRLPAGGVVDGVRVECAVSVECYALLLDGRHAEFPAIVQAGQVIMMRFDTSADADVRLVADLCEDTEDTSALDAAVHEWIASPEVKEQVVVAALAETPSVPADPPTTLLGAEYASEPLIVAPGQDQHVRIVAAHCCRITGVRVDGADDAYFRDLTIAGIPCGAAPTGRENEILVMPGQWIDAWIASPTGTAELVFVLTVDVPEADFQEKMIEK